MNMISRDDCIGLCGLDEAEVQALAEHEHVPGIVAAELAQHLLGQSDGCRTIGAMNSNDVSWAFARGDRQYAEELKSTLHRFVDAHPEVLASSRARACLVR